MRRRYEGYRPSQDILRDVVFHYCGQMRLVDDREDSVCPFNCICDEARVLNHENLVLFLKSDHLVGSKLTLNCEPEGQRPLQPENTCIVSPLQLCGSVM